MPKTMRIMRCAPMAEAHAATISEVSRRDFISSKANSTRRRVPQRRRQGPPRSGHNIGASGQGMGSRRPPKRMKPRAHGPAHLDARAFPAKGKPARTTPASSQNF